MRLYLRERGFDPMGLWYRAEMALRADERQALDEFGEWLRERFGTRLERLALFGSRARGEGSEESDLDVLVVIEGMSFAEGREVGQFCGDLLTRHDVLVSPFALGRDDFDRLVRRERRIAAEIARDGVPL